MQYTKHEKLRYFVRAKKGFPVTSNGLLSFNIKGRCDVDEEFKQVGVNIKLEIFHIKHNLCKKIYALAIVCTK